MEATDTPNADALSAAEQEVLLGGIFEAIRYQLARGLTDEQVRKRVALQQQDALRRLGLNDESMVQLVRMVQLNQDQPALHIGAPPAELAAAERDMLHGGLWLGGGLLVTVGSLVMAAGGRFVMAWGAVIFGGIQFFRGLIRYRQHRAGSDE